ncbi:MAG TPA: STAS domain-containing protein [Herpetosiphonaceae bacterium]
MHEFPTERAALAARIQLFAAFLLVLNLAALAIQALAGSGEDARLALGIVGFNLLILAPVYALRRSPRAAALVVAYLILITLALAAIGPLSGSIDGSTWTLFQIPPLIATIVINQRRITVGLAAFAAAALGLVGASQISGLLPVRLDAAASALWSNLGLQIVALGVVALTIYLLEARALQALERAKGSERRIEQQLGRERELVAKQTLLAEQLGERLRQLAQRERELAAQSSARQALQAAISHIAAPVIPVLPGVVVMPLIGGFDAERAALLTGALLAGVEANRAKVAVIDVTGVALIDEAVAGELLRAARACALLGAAPLLVGIGPEAAQTLAGLGSRLDGLRTAADLQAGVATAMRLLGKSAPPAKD